MLPKTLTIEAGDIVKLHVGPHAGSTGEVVKITSRKFHVRLDASTVTRCALVSLVEKKMQPSAFSC
jgi:ribosomal protein L24